MKRIVKFMKKLSLLILSYFLFAPIYLKAQVGVPVNMQTGAPSITIPIYEIKNGDISVPVSLSYTPGVKIAQPSGNDDFNIGAGWNVNAGGAITRAVNRCYLPESYTTEPPGFVAFNKSYAHISLHCIRSLSLLLSVAITVIHMSFLCLYIPFAYAALILGLLDQVTLATLNIYKGRRSYC